jgi:REP element-mobilizing transposase RayT
MTRGNRKAAIFNEDDDRRRFLTTLADALQFYDATCDAMCLMPNHYHLVLETPRGNVARVMRHVNGVFAQRMNRKYSLTGHLFEARYRSPLIQRETYLKRATRYIVRNPVRAQLVADPADYTWSSYRATAGLEEPPPWLSLEWLNWAYKTDDRAEAQRRYAEFVTQLPDRKAPFPSTALAVGSERFKQKITARVAELRGDLLLPRRPASADRPALTELFGVSGDLSRRDRLIHVARIEHRYPLAEIGAFLNVHPSTVSKAFKRRQETQMQR